MAVDLAEMPSGLHVAFELCGPILCIRLALECRRLRSNDLDSAITGTEPRHQRWCASNDCHIPSSG